MLSHTLDHAAHTSNRSDHAAHAAHTMTRSARTVYFHYRAAGGLTPASFNRAGTPQPDEGAVQNGGGGACAGDGVREVCALQAAGTACCVPRAMRAACREVCVLRAARCVCCVPHRPGIAPIVRAYRPLRQPSPFSLWHAL